MLERDKAQIGDDIWVTGHLGEAAAALELHQKALGIEESLTASEKTIWDALTKPMPPLKFARKLTKLSSCGLDISDGLAADLGHILKKSRCGATLNVESLPVSDALKTAVGWEQAPQYALNGGDDYQLCFTAPQSNRDKINKLAARQGVKVSRIGCITENGLKVLLHGKPFKSERRSWQHFNNDN